MWVIRPLCFILWQQGRGAYCRDYTSTTNIDGEKPQKDGTEEQKGKHTFHHCGLQWRRKGRLPYNLKTVPDTLVVSIENNSHRVPSTHKEGVHWWQAHPL